MPDNQTNDNQTQAETPPTNPLLNQFHKLEKGLKGIDGGNEAAFNDVAEAALSILYAYVLATVRIANALEDTAELQKQLLGAQGAKQAPQD